MFQSSKTSRVLELHNPHSINPARFQIVTSADSPFRFSIESGVIPGDRSKITIIVTFTPIYPMGYYKIVPILIEYQSPILLELVGTCHSDSGKPPVLNDRYLSNFKRLVTRHLALYPFETLTDYLKRGKLTLDENGSLIETEDGASIHDTNAIKDDRNYVVPPLANPLSDNYSYWFSTEDNTRFDYATLSERCFIFDQCMLDANNEWQQSLTVTNLTRGKLTFIWSTPEPLNPAGSSGPVFAISPDTAEIPPLKSTAFRIIFRPTTVDTFYQKHFEGYAFYKNQRDFTLVPDYGVMCPVQYDLTCLGNTLRSNHEVIPKCQLDRDILIFPPMGQQTSIHQTLSLTNQGTTPLIYRLLSTHDEGNSSFTFKPSHGLVHPGNHTIILARYKPIRSSRGEDIAQERFVLRLNEREKFDQALHVFATQEKARLLLPNDGQLHALTTCIGLTSETHFQLKSLTRTQLEFQWTLDHQIPSLRIEPQQGVFSPYEEKDFLIIYQPEQEEKVAMAARLTSWIGDRTKHGVETYHMTVHASTRDGFLRAHELHHEIGSVALGSSATYDLYLTNGSDCLLRYRLSSRQTILSTHKSPSRQGDANSPRDQDEMPILDFLTTGADGCGEIDGKAKMRVPCRIHPFSRSTYQLDLFYELLDDQGERLSEHTHQLCTVIIHGVYPHLAFIDILGSQQAASLSKNLLSKAFNLTTINALLAKEPTTNELTYAIHSHREGVPAKKVIVDRKHRNDDEQSMLEQPEAISFNFNAAPINSAPSEVHLLLENCSDLDTTWSFLFPKDLQCELEYWARTGDFTEDELNEMKLQDNKIFTIQPKKGTLARGSSVTITLSYKHIFAGQHTLPAIFKVGRSRQIMLNLVGTSVEPGEAYVQFYSTIHHLLPVELGAQGAPVQQYELWNGGTVPVHFEVRTQASALIVCVNLNLYSRST
jgi:cilia- and flagella-associated protein 65